MCIEHTGDGATPATELRQPFQVVLVGLEEHLATELAWALRECAAAEVRIIPCEGAEEWLAEWSHGPLSPADAIFCAASASFYRRILGARHRRSTPVIVVSPYEDHAGWLEALEAGAHDYCAPPFEKRQIGWILAGLRAIAEAAPVAHGSLAGR
ncbi:MAG: hypothetical protein RMI94_05630 [Bryobacterales bacterium]|nr:response regulator [Bryobacteraceae bacterium]MDW8130010.1 hypothetical protein [Bryobacterales bacterium]